MSSQLPLAEEAWGRLRDIRHRSELPFPEVRALVSAALTDRSRRARVGNLLETIDISYLSEVDTHCTVQVVGCSTTAPMMAPLRAELVAAGVAPTLSGGDFGSAIDEMLAPSYPSADVLVVLLDATLITDRLPSPWTGEDMTQVLTDVRKLLASALLHAAKGRFIITTTIVLPPNLMRSLTSQQKRTELAIQWREFETALLRLGVAETNIAMIDLNMLLTGPVALQDELLAHVGGLQFSMGLIDEVACEIAHLVRAFAGKSRKALVTDLDDTLWGGILGDDGFENIVSDPDYGSGRQEYQRLLCQLRSQGVLLAVSSKNSRELVQEALSRRDDVLVNEETFILIEADWSPKREQFGRIVKGFNINADAVVFVDDSAFERNDIAAAYPQTLLIDASQDAATLVSRVLHEDPFLVLTSTEADLKRVASLRGSIEVDEARTSAVDFGAYLSGLRQELSLRPMRGGDRARVSQMTQRTNQFHLVTTRLNETSVLEYHEAPGHEVLVVGLRDRHIDHGIVGALFLNAEGKNLVIENMLLSCRVFGRQVEEAIVEAVVAAARKKYTGVRGLFKESAKNQRFANFWIQSGLQRVESESMVTYHIDTGRACPLNERPLSVRLTSERL